MNDGSRQACKTSVSLPVWCLALCVARLACLLACAPPARVRRGGGGSLFPGRFPNLTGHFHLVQCVPVLDRFHVIVYTLTPFLRNATPRENNNKSPLGYRGVWVWSGLLMNEGGWRLNMTGGHFIWRRVARARAPVGCRYFFSGAVRSGCRVGGGGRPGSARKVELTLVCVCVLHVVQKLPQSEINPETLLGHCIPLVIFDCLFSCQSECSISGVSCSEFDLPGTGAPSLHRLRRGRQTRINRHDELVRALPFS